MPDPDPDPVDRLAQKIADKHCAQSMEEMRDPDKVQQWVDGPRAESFSVSELEAALNEILEPEQPNMEANSHE